MSLKINIFDQNIVIINNFYALCCMWIKIVLTTQFSIKYNCHLRNMPKV